MSSGSPVLLSMLPQSLGWCKGNLSQVIEKKQVTGGTEQSHAKALIKNTGIFAIGTFGSKILTLLIIPLCTHYIATDDMGVYDMVYTIIALLQPIAVLAIPESLFRWVIDVKADKKSVYSTWLGLFVGLTAAFTAIFWICWLVVGFADAGLMYVLVVLSCLYQSFQYGTRGLHNNKLFAISGIVYSIVYCLGCYLLVAVLNVGYHGLLYAMLAATIVASLFLVAPQRELRSFAASGIDGGVALEMLRYSLFLLPNQLSWWAMTMLGRLIIVGFMGYSANGIFSVAMKFPSALSMISNIFTPAWQEQAVMLFEKKGKDEYFSKVFNQYAILLVTLLIPGVPVTKLFVQLAMDSSYFSCFNYVALLYLGAALNALSAFAGVLYMCAKDTKGAASTTVIGAAVNIVVSLVLVPLTGLMGAALGNFLGNAAILVARLRQTHKYCAMNVDWARIVTYGAIVVTVSFLAAALTSLVMVGALSLFCVILFCFANRSSVKNLRGFLNK